MFTCINFALFCKSYVVELVRESFTTLILNIESNQGKSTPGELLNFLLSFISCNYHCELLNITVLPSKCETAKTTVANLLSLFYYMFGFLWIFFQTEIQISISFILLPIYHFKIIYNLPNFQVDCDAIFASEEIDKPSGHKAMQWEMIPKHIQVGTNNAHRPYFSFCAFVICVIVLSLFLKHFVI